MGAGCQASAIRGAAGLVLAGHGAGRADTRPAVRSGWLRVHPPGGRLGDPAGSGRAGWLQHLRRAWPGFLSGRRRAAGGPGEQCQPGCPGRIPWPDVAHDLCARVRHWPDGGRRAAVHRVGRQDRRAGHAARRVRDHPGHKARPAARAAQADRPGQRRPAVEPGDWQGTAQVRWSGGGERDRRRLCAAVRQDVSCARVQRHLWPPGHGQDEAD